MRCYGKQRLIRHAKWVAMLDEMSLHYLRDLTRNISVKSFTVTCRLDVAEKHIRMNQLRSNFSDLVALRGTSQDGFVPIVNQPEQSHFARNFHRTDEPSHS